MPIYASSDAKSLRALEILIRSIIKNLQKCNVCTKKCVKSLQEWLEAYIDFGLQTLNSSILYCSSKFWLWWWVDSLIMILTWFSIFFGNKVHNQNYPCLISIAFFLKLLYYVTTSKT
jgi:hypothetical protein